jgi:TrmH family RNA methyltransferase
MVLSELKFLRSLHRKSNRREHRCFLLEGTKLVKEILESDFVVKQLYATRQWLTKHPDFSYNVQIVSEKECERISFLTSPPAVFALVEMKPECPFSPERYRKLLLLDEIKDAGNFGAIIRTADWFGIEGIVCSENTVELYNPKTIHATMGSFTRVNIYTYNLCDFIREYAAKYAFIGAFMEGKPVQEYVFPEYSAIVLGNESRGISFEVSSLIEEKLTIPQRNQNRISELFPESLNVSISAAIICYELTKQDKSFFSGS